MITFCIFALFPLVLNHPLIKPHTTIYTKLDLYPLWYWILIFPVMLIMHDTYFYFTHRMMHHPRSFNFFHLVHHKSTNPSPWAAFSFNPSEAVVEAGIIYVFAFTIPIHFLHIFVFLIFMTAYMFTVTSGMNSIQKDSINIGSASGSILLLIIICITSILKGITDCILHLGIE